MAEVLVIDDEPDLRSSCGAAGDGRHEVSEAPDGAVGIRIVDEHDVDVVIVDTAMPVMDGRS